MTLNAAARRENVGLDERRVEEVDGFYVFASIDLQATRSRTAHGNACITQPVWPTQGLQW